MSYTTKYSEKMYISGAGGASHEGCRINIWKFCNDVDFGFLEFNTTGTIIPKFYDSDGKMVYNSDAK